MASKRGIIYVTIIVPRGAIGVWQIFEKSSIKNEKPLLPISYEERIVLSQLFIYNFRIVCRKNILFWVL